MVSQQVPDIPPRLSRDADLWAWSSLGFFLPRSPKSLSLVETCVLLISVSLATSRAFGTQPVSLTGESLQEAII